MIRGIERERDALRADFAHKDAIIAAQREVLTAHDEYDAIVGHPELWADEEAHHMAICEALDKLAKAREGLWWIESGKPKATTEG